MPQCGRYELSQKDKITLLERTESWNFSIRQNQIQVKQPAE